MDDVIHVFSSPTPRDPSLRVDLGLVEITDSEPEDHPDSEDMLWTGRKTQPNASSHLHKDRVKEYSPMDVDIPAPQAGPSSHPPAPDPFPDAPPVLVKPELDLQEADMDPYSKHLSLVLEFVPDVPPQHASQLIEKHYQAYGDQVGEWVVQILVDQPSYPKPEMGGEEKRKGKRKASEMEDVADDPPLRVKIDLASVNRPKPTGKNYKVLALVSCPTLTNPDAPRHG